MKKARLSLANILVIADAEPKWFPGLKSKGFLFRTPGQLRRRADIPDETISVVIMVDRTMDGGTESEKAQAISEFRRLKNLLNIHLFARVNHIDSVYRYARYLGETHRPVDEGYMVPDRTVVRDCLPKNFEQLPREELITKLYENLIKQGYSASESTLRRLISEVLTNLRWQERKIASMAYQATQKPSSA